MTKEDYREKVEEHRQEIDLHNESGTKMSRASRHQKKGKKKQSNPIMTILVVVLIFIPLTILGYVWLFYEPSASNADKVEGQEKEDFVVIEKKDPSTSKDAVVDSEEKKKTDDSEEKKAAEAEAEKKLQQEKERLAAEEVKKAAQKAKELEEKKKAEQAAKAQQKTHTVQSTDNLYRIAIKYYGNGSPANIEKIKAANNLTSDSISTGQVLVIIP